MHRKQVNTQHSKLYRRVRKLQKRLTQHSGRIDAGLVHDIRVLCKKVRAELTLLKYKKKKVRLKVVSKEIAGSLSQIRDAEVMLETFDGLFPETCEVPLKKLRQGLVAELNKQAIDGQSLNARVGVLKRELKDCSFSLEKGVENPVSINKAKAKSYRRFMQLDVANSETFHDWRKSVKAYL